MNIKLDFSKGAINSNKTYFEIETKNNIIYYAGHLFQTNQIIRANCYYIRNNGKGTDVIGEYRIPINNIKEIRIKGKKY